MSDAHNVWETKRVSCPYRVSLPKLGRCAPRSITSRCHYVTRDTIRVLFIYPRAYLTVFCVCVCVCISVRQSENRSFSIPRVDRTDKKRRFGFYLSSLPVTDTFVRVDSVCPSYGLSWSRYVSEFVKIATFRRCAFKNRLNRPRVSTELVVRSASTSQFSGELALRYR